MRACLVVGLCVALAGCGGGGSDETTASKPAATATAHTSAPDVKPASLAPDEQPVADVALRYVHAIAGKDWESACETRSTREQAQFAQMAGSCARMFETMFKGKAMELFATVQASEVRIKGNLAGVDLVQPGQTKPVMTLSAVKRHGEWVLEDMKDSKVP
jgi:hypothetical protein